MKKLEELLNLPSSKEIISEEGSNSKQLAQRAATAEKEEQLRSLSELDDITASLPRVSGLGAKADNELDDIANRALTAYEDLMNLGMNVESRYSGRVFEVAGSMLKTSLDAKVAKIDKKIKMIELQLKKEKLSKNTNDDAPVEGTGYVVTDRNSLLAKLKGLDSDK
jgi:hypothetical protein